MGEDERLARLTELAQRVFGEHAAPQPVQRFGCSAERGSIRERGWGVFAEGSPCTLVMGDNALDALEAALLVLAEDVTIREVRYAGCPRSVCRPASPAWVEQLAAALEYRSGVDQYVIDGDRWRELRARAKGGERG